MGSAHARALATRTSHLLVALLIAAMFAFAVWQALSNTSQTTTNSIEAGTLSITDDNPGSSALFTVPNVQDGSTGEKCITVENDGSIEYDTLLLSRSGPSAYQQLAHAITWQVHRLDGPAVDTTAGSCTAYNASAHAELTVPVGGVALSSATTDTELDALKAPGSKASYRISYSVDMENEQQGQSIGGIAFTWNATQSSSVGGTIQHWASIGTVPAPVHVAAASNGYLYFVNVTNSKLRRVDANGAVMDVADIGATTLQGLAVRGNYAYISDQQGHRVYRVDLTDGTSTVFAGTGIQGHLGDGGAATAAQLNSPTGLTLDSAGDLYIATAGRIRKIDTTTGDITTFATASGTYALHALGDDTILASHQGANRVYRYDTSGDATLFAGTGTAGHAGDGGPATDAELNLPAGLASDAAGNVYIADPLNCSIRRVDPSGMISTIAGSGDQGDYTTCADTGDGATATAAVLAVPFSLAVGPDGKLYSAQLLGSSIRVIDL